MPSCPECGSKLLYRDGLRYTDQGSVQRFLCRSCGYRFSQPNVKLNVIRQALKGSHPGQNHADRAITGRDLSSKEAFNGLSFIGSEDVGSHELTTVGKGLNALRIYNSEYRVCASHKRAKNLEAETQIERPSVDGTQTQQDIKGKLVEYAFYMQNPRLLRVSFHTFRHWKATMEYHETHDPYYVKQFLGHKSLRNTEIYINIERTLFEPGSDEFTVKVTDKAEEVKTLLEVGFEYVCQKEGLIFLRKRK